MYKVIHKSDWSNAELAQFQDPAHAVRYVGEMTDELNCGEESFIIETPRAKFIMSYTMNSIVTITPRSEWEKLINENSFN